MSICPICGQEVSASTTDRSSTGSLPSPCEHFSPETTRQPTSEKKRAKRNRSSLREDSMEEPELLMEEKVDGESFELGSVTMENDVGKGEVIEDVHQIFTPLREESTIMREKTATLQKQHAALRKEHAALRKEHAALRKENAALRKENAALKVRIEALERQVQELMNRLK